MVNADVMDGMTFSVDDRAGDTLRDFYEGYERAFVLPSERETFEGFESCFGLNGATFPFVTAPFREVVMVVRDEERDERLGGANFFVSQFGSVACVALNYIYVEAAARGRGLLRRMVGAVPGAASRFLPEPVSQTLQFIEMNDPLKLDPAAAAVDSAHSGLGQMERLAIWARLGAMLVDHDYVQPPLSPDQDADRSLALAVLGASGPALDAALFESHLRHFFGISVLKGRDPASVHIPAEQIERVSHRTDIRLFSLERTLRQAGQAAASASLIDLARETQQ